MSRLILTPKVHLVASTVVHSVQLEDWANDHDLDIGKNEALAKLHTAVDMVNFDNEADDRSVDRVAEFAGRHCYRAWNKGRDNADYLRNIVESGHGSVLHHGTMVFAISGISRSLSLELLRHRVGADPSQESQRYVEAKDMKFVVPPLIIRMAEQNNQYGEDMIAEFENQCLRDVIDYNFWIRQLKHHFGEVDTTIDKKRFLEAARSRLPNAAETRLVFTMNMRSLRWVCAQRGASFADLEIRRLAVELLKFAKRYAPNTFYDFEPGIGDDGFPIVTVDQKTAKV